MRGATPFADGHFNRWCISIHAPHAGSDATKKRAFCKSKDFNPRSPCGERLGFHGSPSHELTFQSTLPMRGATYSIVPSARTWGISIHAPHAGSDGSWRVDADTSQISIHAPHAGSDNNSDQWLILSINFNPRSPCGERHTHLHVSVCVIKISIHAPHAGSDDGHLDW